jgi:dihydrofolate reductase
MVEVVPSLDEVGKLFERERIRSVYIDGGEVVQACLRRGWLDEIVLTHAPILLGSGIPLFRYLSRDIRMTLLGVDVIEHGMVSAHYRVVRDGDGE